MKPIVRRIRHVVHPDRHGGSGLLSFLVSVNPEIKDVKGIPAKVKAGRRELDEGEDRKGCVEQVEEGVRSGVEQVEERGAAPSNLPKARTSQSPP